MSVGGSPKEPEPEAAEPVEPAPVAPPAAPPEEDWATRFKYLLADFENYRRRVERERDQARRSGQAAVLRELLPLWEATERARTVVARLPPKDPVRSGLEILVGEWERFFEAEGVVPTAEVGAPFRSEVQEAVGESRPTAKVPDGAVLEIVQQGYRTEDGVLRAAKVIVARKPDPAPPEPEGAADPEEES